MNLDGYVSELRSQLAAVAVNGDADTRAVAERLSVSLDAAVRLVLLEVLSDVASELTRELAPGSVDLRVRGRNPELVVSRPAAPEFSDASAQDNAPEPRRADETEPLDDTVTSRTTLRLPDQLKARVDRAAAEDRLSVNAWLVRAIATSLEPKNRRAARRETRSGDSFTGWAR